MGAEPNNIRELLSEIKSARLDIGARDQKTRERIDELEISLNEVLLGMRRPGGESHGGDRDLERKSAIQMCVDRHAWRNQKNEGGRWVEYRPGSDEVDEALSAMQAWRSILRHGDLQRLDDIERKALTSFSFGSAGWVVPPQVSTRILSCLTDPTDVLSMFSHEAISAGSIQYPIDNVEMENVGWACEFECFGPQANLQPRGMIEIKAEGITRCRLCHAGSFAGRELQHRAVGYPESTTCLPQQDLGCGHVRRWHGQTCRDFAPGEPDPHL
jgi:HK97 family phage major capsid protein